MLNWQNGAAYSCNQPPQKDLGWNHKAGYEKPGGLLTTLLFGGYTDWQAIAYDGGELWRGHNQKDSKQQLIKDVMDVFNV